VLISEHGTAHLADFESVREQPAAGAASRTASRSAGRSGGAVATRKYEAPEMRAGTVPKATAASDMYSFGVCALLACCELADYSFAPEDQPDELRSWDRAAAAAKGGPHLPTLLDELLDLQQPPAASAAEAVNRRLSAREVLCHPFLDASAERAQARAATELAAAAAHEASQQLAAVEREAARKQREADWREAELRRQQEEQLAEIQKALREGERQAAKRKLELQKYEKQVEMEQKKLQAQEAAVAQAEQAAAASVHEAEEKRKAAADEVKRQKAKAEEMRQKAKAEQAEAEKKKAELKAQVKAEQAKVDEEKTKLAKLQSERIHYPGTWRMVRSDTPADGLFDVPESSNEFSQMARRLVAAMRGPPGCSGFGVKLLALQRVQNDVLWRRYHHERAETARRKSDANEKFLWMSSGDATDPKIVALSDHGFDPSFSYGLPGGKSYGAGAYFAKWPLYSHAFRPCPAARFRPGQAGHLIILAQVALGDVKDYGAKDANHGSPGSSHEKQEIRKLGTMGGEPPKPGGGQYDSWSGTEGDLHWSSGSTHRNALKAHGAEYGRQYIVCRYQKAYPQYILRYQIT